MSKTVIWQVFTRLFCNSTEPAGLVPGGTLSENGCGKMNSYTSEVLDYFRSQGATHIWFTGLLAHASRTDYPAYGIPASHPSTVKGRAGSPYAIRDYYDIDPDLQYPYRSGLLDSMLLSDAFTVPDSVSSWISSLTMWPGNTIPSKHRKKSLVWEKTITLPSFSRR